MRRFTSRRGALGFLMVGALAASITTAGASLALFTDTETVDGVFTSGTIILDGAQIDALSLSTGALMPGDVITDDVVVANIGTGELRYDLTAATADTNSPNGNPLSDVLLLQVREVDVDLAGCGSFDGAVVFSSAVIGATTAIDTDRVLAATVSETLCFRVSLPLATGNTFQGATATSTFTFAAEQTANN